jgi:hypothetical protein
VLLLCKANNKTSDNILIRKLFCKLFSEDEILRGNLTGDGLRGSQLAQKPEKWNEDKLNFIYGLHKQRLVILGETMDVAIERMERQVFNNVIRDTSNPFKRKDRESKKRL